jgi:small conductance mechanosensitive channel
MIALLLQSVPPSPSDTADQPDAWALVADRMGDGMVAWAPVLLAASLILVVGWLAARSGSSLLQRWLARAEFDPTLGKFLGSLSYFLLLTVAVIAALGKLGVETTSFVAVLGAAGLAIGLALQGSLGNLASGVMVMVFRPFAVGDGIAVAGHEGKVEEIGVFATVLHTGDGREVRVPNSALTSGAIVNLTRLGRRKVETSIVLDGREDPRRAKEVLAAAAGSCADALRDPPAAAAISAWDGHGLKVSVAAWAEAQSAGALADELHCAIKDCVEREGLRPAAAPPAGR